ncbi:MAG: hypothetical protein ACTS27_08725 [Phycisphaerales bacterium]
MKIGILASAVGLAVSAVALAEATKSSDLIPISKHSFVDPEMQVFQQIGFPQVNNSLVNVKRAAVNLGGKTAVPFEGPSATVDPRGTPNVVSVQTDYELAPADTSLGGTGVIFAPSFTSGTVPANVGWNLRGQTSTAFVRVIDPVNNPGTPAPAAGPNGVDNQTKMVRHNVATAQAAGGFFTGHNSRVVADTMAAMQGDFTTFPIAPTADNDAEISMEVFNTTTAELNTFEPVATFTGFITGRILYGGTCVEVEPGDCTDIGLPIGNILNYTSLGPNPASFTTGIFVPTFICEDAQGLPIMGCTPPPGTMVGDPAAIVVGQWHEMIGRTTSEGRFTVLIDRLDGNPAYNIYENVLLTSGFMDRVGSNASFESQDAQTFFDNASMDGEPFELPTPPALECAYLDDVEWLNSGPVLGQTGRIFAALSSALTVIDDGARGQVYRQTNNIRPDNQYREEFNTALPNSVASAGDPWELCWDVRSSGATVRGFAIDSELTNFVAGGVTTRVFLGRETTMSPYEPSIYVQINVAYDPIDDIESANPLLDNEAIIGTDIEDTGADWAGGTAYREICVAIDVDNNMTLSVNGSSIWTGSAASNGAAELSFESENNVFGSDSQMRVNDIDFACSALPIVDLPDLVVPYNDDFEWGVVGIAPERHIDDPMNSPLASTRYTNANGVLIDEASVARGTSKVVAMQNVFRDTTQIAPPDINQEDPFVFTQFTTETPSVAVTPGGTDKWVVEMDWSMNDFTTSRGWAPAQLADVGGGGELITTLWYSAIDDNFYFFTSPDGAMAGDDLVTVATGVSRTSLGITPGSTFSVRAEYLPATDKVAWSVNGTSLGETNPIVGTDDLGNERIHRNLDFVFIFGGDDDTGTPLPPLSTLFMDNLSVTTGDVVCDGDTNGDNVINFTDLNAVLSTFGQTGAGIPGDVDGNMVVNFSDLNLVLSNFGNTCP